MKLYLACLVAPVLLAACKPESTPQPKEKLPASSAATDPANPDSYIGLDEKAAEELADKANLAWQIIEVDGQPKPATRDYRPERLNFAIKDGKVIRVTRG